MPKRNCRFVSALVATCLFTASGFSPSTGKVNVRLDTIDLEEFQRVVPSSKSGSGGSNLPPVIQSIADERKDFHVNLGKAMDTLRKDMPYILKKAPDYQIYHDELVVVDPSGVTLEGLDNYKSAVSFFQTFIKFWFKERSGLQFRMVYDFCRSSIKVSWNAVLIPKVPLGRPIFVDLVSLYKLDAESGLIIEHKLEKLVINNTPVAPPYGVLNLMQLDLGLAPKGVPVGPGIPAGI